MKDRHHYPTIEEDEFIFKARCLMHKFEILGDNITDSQVAVWVIWHNNWPEPANWARSKFPGIIQEYEDLRLKGSKLPSWVNNDGRWQMDWWNSGQNSRDFIFCNWKLADLGVVTWDAARILK